MYTPCNTEPHEDDDDDDDDDGDGDDDVDDYEDDDISIARSVPVEMASQRRVGHGGKPWESGANQRCFMCTVVAH